MTDQSREAMKETCHFLAEYILRQPQKSNRAKWLQQQLLEQLTTKSHIDWYVEEYDKEYEYADVPTEYLATILKEYDQEVR